MSEVRETLGQRLRAEREHKGLSAQKAADELRLDGWVVEGLETDDYSRIGPSVYVKGHLKRYAEFLGLPSAEILAAHGSVPTPAVAAESSQTGLNTSPAADVPWPRVVAVAGVVVVAVLIGWWKPWHRRQSSPPAAVAATPRAATPGGAISAVTTPAMTGPGGPANAAEQATTHSAAASTEESKSSIAAASGAPAPSATASGASASRAEAEPGAGHARLRLRFSADSWVDVRDALGQRVYAGNGRANSVKTLGGAAPLRVYLGSANGVQLEINHHAVTIAPQYVVGNTAHFEAGADGVLRRDPHLAVSRPHG